MSRCLSFKKQEDMNLEFHYTMSGNKSFGLKRKSDRGCKKTSSRASFQLCKGIYLDCFDPKEDLGKGITTGSQVVISIFNEVGKELVRLLSWIEAYEAVEVDHNNCLLCNIFLPFFGDSSELRLFQYTDICPIVFPL